MPVSDYRVGHQRTEARHVPQEFLAACFPAAGTATVMTRGAERLTYQIRVRGELTDALVAALEPLGLRVEQTSEGPVLIGIFRDQAELHGALQALQDLGVELVEMRQAAGWT